MENQLDVQPITLDESPWVGGRRYITDADQNIAQQKYDAEADKVSMGQIWSDTLDQDWVFSSYGRWKDERTHEVDPTFQLTEDKLKVASEGLPLDYQYVFEDAHSDSHLEFLRQQMLRKVERDKNFEAGGLAGMGVRLAGNIADPVNLVLSALTAPLSMVSKGNRLLSALKGGALVAGENVALEATLYAGDPSKEMTDLLYAAGGGLILGGAAGSLAHGGGSIADEMMTNLAHHANDMVDDIGTAAKEAAAVQRGVSRVDAVDPSDVTRTLREEAQLIRADRKSSRMAVEASESQLAKLDRELMDHHTALDDLNSMLDDGSSTSRSMDDMNAAMDWLKDYDKYVILNGRNAAKYPESNIPDPSSLTGEMKNIVGEYLGNKAGLKRDIDELSNYSATRTVTPEDHALKAGELNTKITDLQVRAAKHQAKIETMRGKQATAERRHKVWKDKRDASLKALAKQLEGSPVDAGDAGVAVRNDSAGAMKADPRGAPIEINEDIAGEFSHNQKNYGKTAFEKARYGLAAQFSKLKIRQLAWFGHNAVLDAVGREGGAVNVFSATEKAHLLSTTMRVMAGRATAPAFKAWAKSRGLHAGNRMFHRAAFGKELAALVRTGAKGPSDEMNKAAEAIANVFEKVGIAAREAGVAGFENFVPNRQYLPRLIDMGQVATMRSDYRGGVEDLFETAIRSANPSIDAKYAKAIAHGYWNKLVRLEAGLDGNMNNMMSGSTRDAIEDSLRTFIDPDTGKMLDKDVVNEVMDRLATEKTLKATPVDRAKSRVLFDEDISVEMKNWNTGEMDTVHITDLFDNNAEQLVNTYLRQMSGRIAISEIDPKRFGSEAAFKTFLERTRIYASDQLGMAGEDIKPELELAQYTWDHLMGRPLEKDMSSRGAAFGRTLRDWNFVRLMGQVGFAQIPEFANVVAFGGWKAMLSHMPDMVSLIKRAQDGTLNNELSDELELLLGTGADWLINPVGARFDDFGMGSKILETGTRVTTAVSGMAPINTFLHRITSRVVAQRFANMANGVGKLEGNELAQLGLTEAMRDKIFEQLKKHGSFESSALTGRKITKLNTLQWDDQDVASTFVKSMSRLSRKIIQENDIGSSARWMNSTTGKILMQFRTFQNGAYEKQLLSNAYIGGSNPVGVLQAVTGSALLGATAYILQMHAQAILRPDGKEHRADKLTNAKIAAAGFSRAGFASFLPGIIDTTLDLTGNDAVFSHSRTTGQESNLITGNPTYDFLFNRTKGSLKGLAAPILQDDYQYSKKDLSNQAGMLAFQNTLAGAAAVQWVSHGLRLPSKSQ